MFRTIKEKEKQSAAMSFLAGNISFRSIHIGWLIFYSLLCIVVLSVIGFATLRPLLVLPRIRLAPGFAFKNVTEARSSRSDQFLGGLTIYTFTFADCLLADASCDIDINRLNRLYRDLTPLQTPHLPIRMVTILLDETIKADQFSDVNLPPEWSLIHGNPVHTRYVVGQGFNLFYASAGEGGRVENYVTPGVVLVDEVGMIRSEYRSGIPSTDILMRDIGLLTEEVQNRDGITRIGYEAAHLFICYP